MVACVNPDQNVEDNAYELNDQGHCDQNLDHYEPRWHDPVPDLIELRTEDPPASMIRLLCGVPVQDLSCKTSLPQTNLTKSRVDPGPGYDPVGGTKRYDKI